MKQKKIGDILYVFSNAAYQITEDTDATVIKIQEECIPAFAALNESLVSKFSPINYKLFCVIKPEWADYYDDLEIIITPTVNGTVTVSPASADMGEEVTITTTPNEGYLLDSLVVMCGSTEVTVTDNKFTMPAESVTVTATFKQDIVPYEQQYFTIESEADNNYIIITLVGMNPDNTSRNPFSVSRDDGATWTTIELDQGNYVYSTKLSEGDKILMKSTNKTFSINTDDSMFSISGSFKVYGNIMSLLYGDNFANQTSFPADSSYNFQQLLYYCGNLSDASNLILPATTLTEMCYSKMFYYCQSLTTPPKLPATTVVPYAYDAMFSNTQITELIMLATSINFENNNLNIPDTNGTVYVNPNADSTIRSYFTSSDWTVVDYVPNV